MRDLGALSLSLRKLGFPGVFVYYITHSLSVVLYGCGWIDDDFILELN